MIPFIEFAVSLIGLGLAARLFPWLPGFINWFFLFPLCIVTFGTIPYLLVVMITESWMSLGVYAAFLFFIGLPVGIAITRVANSA
jgi:hypothetical protein